MIPTKIFSHSPGFECVRDSAWSELCYKKNRVQKYFLTAEQSWIYWAPVVCCITLRNAPKRYVNRRIYGNHTNCNTITFCSRTNFQEHEVIYFLSRFRIYHCSASFCSRAQLLKNSLGWARASGSCLSDCITGSFWSLNSLGCGLQNES